MKHFDIKSFSFSLCVAIAAIVLAPFLAVYLGISIPNNIGIFNIFFRNNNISNVKVFTKNELANLQHGESKIIALAIGGKVYDVTSGKTFYGKGEGYGFFAFTDGTRAFVTGQFDAAGVTDDISDFTPSQCVGVKTWVDFYEKSDKYHMIGLLAGYFYDENGQPTKGMTAYQNCLQLGLLEKEQEDNKIPDCKMHIDFVTQNKRVWCDEGFVPRKATFARGSNNEMVEKCFCIDTKDVASRGDMLQYNSCDPKSFECFERINIENGRIVN